MIKEGYAHEYTYNKAYKYQSQFKQALQHAKDNKLGLWAENTCNGVTNQEHAAPAPTPVPSATPRTTPQQTPSPSQPPTSVYYKNCSEARAAGAAPVYAGQPGYGTHLDRDRDGIGCE